MAQHTVPANELAIKALRCPEGKARVVYHVDGHGNDGTQALRRAQRNEDLVLSGSGARQQPQRYAARSLAGRDDRRCSQTQKRACRLNRQRG